VHVKVPYTVTECVPTKVCKQVKVCVCEDVCVKRCRKVPVCPEPTCEPCCNESWFSKLFQRRLCCDPCGDSCGCK
jgi:hypothetical protein